MKKINNEIKDVHNKIREILQKYGNTEYGDCIVDEICSTFGYATTTGVDLLEEAMGKITFEMMNSLPNGETQKLNERFSLYKYLDEDVFVLEDNEDEFEYSVMYDESNNNSIVFEEF